jgi:CHAT domain-containing protein
MMAGAKAVIGSLWEVPDKETAELFETFYRNLRAGVDSVHALRNAQLAMRARQFPASDWAAFVHYGQAYSIA